MAPYAKHFLVDAVPNPEKKSGNSVPWEVKYYGICLYTGFAESAFTKIASHVTCKRCLAKMKKGGLTPDAPDGAKSPASEELTEKEFQALARWWG